MKIISQYRGLRRELYVLFFCHLIDDAGSMVGPMLTLILSAKMGMDSRGIALYFLIYTVLALPVHLFGGRLTDRVNKKVLINICDVTTSAIYIVCGCLELSYAVIGVYMFGSLLQKVESPAYKSLIADFSTAKDRDRAYSLNYLGMNLGMVLAPTLGGFMIADHLGLMFILSGVFQLLSLLVFDIFVKDIRAVRDDGNRYEKSAEKGSALKVLWDSRVLLPFLFIFALSMFVYNMYGYLLPLTLENRHGELGSVFYGTVSSVNCVTVIVMTSVLTALFAKKTSVTKMIFGNIFEVLGLAAFVIFLGKPVFYYVAMVIFTFGEILNTVTTTPHLTRRIPLNYRGRALAISSVFSDLFGAAGKYGVGKIYDTVGENAAWTVVLAVGVFTVFAYVLLGIADKKAYPDLYEKQN